MRGGDEDRGGLAAVSYMITMEASSPKMTFEKRLQRRQGVTHMAIWRKTVPGKEKSTSAHKGKCIWMWDIYVTGNDRKIC